jgi:hypothetical protein
MDLKSSRLFEGSFFVDNGNLCIENCDNLLIICLLAGVIFPDCLRLEKWEISTVVSNIGIGF